MALHLIFWCLRSRLVFLSRKDFKTATTGVAAKAMKNELSRLVNAVAEPAKKVWSFLLPTNPPLTMVVTLSRLIQRCSHFSTSLPVTSPNGQRVKKCVFHGFCAFTMNEPTPG